MTACKEARHPLDVSAVVGTFKLEDFWTSRERACQPHTIARGLGSRSTETQFLSGGTDTPDLFANSESMRIEIGKVRAIKGLCANSLNDFGARVTDEA